MTAPGRTVAPGDRVGGKYELVQRIASGGMGDVWKARNVVTGGYVAVKRCRTDLPDDDLAARFRHEARLGATLAHRAIVRVFDFVEDLPGGPFLVMELLRGRSVERRIAEEGPVPVRTALAIAVAALAALAHAHDRGVLHRDVTPGNVFLAVDTDGQVSPKLVDFGIAKARELGVKTADGRILGTPRYMAPERIRGSDVDARSDLFSVGVVLYEMLTGECPFAADTPAASLAAVLEVVVDPAPQIPPRLWVELQRALSKRPYERHASARELSAALLAASDETEASLLACLRGPPPPAEEPPSAGVPSVDTTGAIGTRAGVRRWLALPAIAIVSIGVVAMLGHPRARNSASPAAPMPAARTFTAAPPGAEETSSPVPAATTPAPASSFTGPAASVERKVPRAPQRPHAKPIATNPGF